MKKEKPRKLQGFIGIGVIVLSLYACTTIVRNKAPEASRPASALQPDVMKKDIIGCNDLDTYKRMNRFVVAGDRDAFAELLAPALKAGVCRRFKAGDTVRLEDTDILSGSDCVRPQGEIRCFWIPIDASGPS